VSPRGVRLRAGKRAAAYIEEHACATTGGKVLAIPDLAETPAGVRRTLTRLLGRPTTVDRGETAYWFVDPEVVE